MKKKDLAHVQAQAKAASELEEQLEYAENQLVRFGEERNAGYCVSMDLTFRDRSKNKHMGDVSCRDSPHELLCLAGLILKERRDWLQKQFDDLTIGTTAPEDRQ